MADNVDYIELVAKASGDGELKKLGGIVDELMKRAKSAGVGVDEFAEKLKKLGKTANSTEPYDKLIGKLKQVAGVTAVVAGVKKSINIFMGFDDTMRRVQGTTGATAKEFQMLTDSAKLLGKTTSWSATDVASAQYEFAKAGFNVNEILAGTKGILNTATVAQMGLAEATEMTAGVLRIFKLDASQASYVGDALAKTASSTTTDIKDLAESLKYAGVGAGEFGLDMEQTLSILGKLGDLSIKGSQAGTGLKAVFSALQDKRKVKLLKTIDVHVTGNGKFRNLIDIMKDIETKSAKLLPAQASSLINEVFGEQGALVMKNLLNVPKEELDKLTNEIRNSKGFSQEFAELLENGLGGAHRSLKSAIEGVAIAVGGFLAPTLKSILEIITPVINGVSNFIDWLNGGSTVANNLKAVLGALIVGFATYKAIMIGTTIATTLFTKAQMIKDGILLAGKVATGLYNIALLILTGNTVGATIATTALGIAMGVTTAPITAVIALVVGLVAGFVLLYKKCETFRNGLHWLGEKFLELVKKVTGIDIIYQIFQKLYEKSEFFRNGLHWLSEKFLELVKKATGIGFIYRIFQKLYEKSEFFRDAVNRLTEAFKKLFEYIKKMNIIQKGIDGVKSIYNNTRKFLGLEVVEEANTDKGLKDTENGTGTNTSNAIVDKNASAGAGINTDDLVFGGDKKKKKSDKLKHNGYYLRGDKNLTNIKNISKYNKSNSVNINNSNTSYLNTTNNSSNVKNSSSNNSNVYTSQKIDNRTTEEKIYDILVEIKNKIGRFKGNTTISKNNSISLSSKNTKKDDEVVNFIDDLMLALGN